MKIKLRDVPDDLMTEIGSQLKNYLVPICGLSPQSANDPFRFAGSGTLVIIDKSHHILTAAHVLREIMNMEEIGLVLTDFPSQFKIPRELSVKEVWSGKISEWGPDLALLEIPKSAVSIIEAHKSFLNLVQQRDTQLAETVSPEVGPWVLTGMIGQFSRFVHHPDSNTVKGTAEARALFSGINSLNQNGGHDYIDLIADLGLSDVPQSFGGMSGGGLWQISLRMDKSGEVSWDGTRRFRGVAFWQSEISQGRRNIRCHGPKSVFETAWNLWNLPEKANAT